MALNRESVIHPIDRVSLLEVALRSPVRPPVSSKPEVTMTIDRDMFHSLAETAAEGLRKAHAATNDGDLRDGVAMATRAITRLWSTLNPKFVNNETYGPVSAMVNDHWPEIVALQHGADSPDDLWGSTPSAPPILDDSFVSNIGPLCARLAAEPLFGGRELVHSNLLAWFIDAEPAVASVFAAWGTRDDREAKLTERERYSFDLVVHPDQRAPIVVENKTFSHVDEAQLERYTPKAVGHLGTHVSLVLLSLADPGWEDGQRIFGERAWVRRSYGELGAALALAADHITSGADAHFRAELLRRYASMLGTLHQLAERLTHLEPSDPIEIRPEWATDLKRVRLHTGFAKLRSQALARLLNDQGPEGVRGDVTRGQVLLERFERVAGSEDLVGWQLQGKQWRLAVRVGSADNGHGKGPENRSRREDYVSETYGNYFDLGALDGPLNPGNQRRWGAFAPDFVYRYGVLSDGATIDDLVALSRSSAKRAASYVAK
jgi:hypothetical protein